MEAHFHSMRLLNMGEMIARVLHGYVDLLTWPLVALIAIIIYRGVIRSILPGATVKLRISNVTIETTLPVIEHSITESLQGKELNAEQWEWLDRLRTQEKVPISDADRALLRPLRDSGLIRACPKGYLQNAKAVEITTLGRLLVEASRRK